MKEIIGLILCLLLGFFAGFGFGSAVEKAKVKINNEKGLSPKELCEIVKKSCEWQQKIKDTLEEQYLKAYHNIDTIHDNVFIGETVLEQSESDNAKFVAQKVKFVFKKYGKHTVGVICDSSDTPLFGDTLIPVYAKLKKKGTSHEQ